MTEPYETLNVLLIDEFTNSHQVLYESMNSLGCKNIVSQSIPAATEALQLNPFDFFLIHFNMGQKAIRDLIKATKKMDLNAIVIVMVDFPSLEMAIEKTHEEAFDYLISPVSSIQLQHFLNKLRYILKIKKENVELKNFSI